MLTNNTTNDTYIIEHQWRIEGIATPDNDQQIFEVIEDPFVWYEEPIVIEPEKTMIAVWKYSTNLSTVRANSNYLKSVWNTKF